MKTVSHPCPRCGEHNCFNVKDSIKEVSVDWFVCSFCNNKAQKKEWAIE